MKNRKIAAIGTALFLMLSLSGCSQVFTQDSGNASQEQSDSSRDTAKEDVFGEDGTLYTSKDQSISLVLPEGWSASKDQLSSYEFSSEYGLISIMYEEGNANMANTIIPVQKSKIADVMEELGYSSNSWKLEAYGTGLVGDKLQFYKYQLSISAVDTNYVFQIGAGINSSNRAYQVRADLLKDDQDTIDTVNKIISTFTILSQKKITTSFQEAFLSDNLSTYSSENGVSGNGVCNTSANIRNRAGGDDSSVIGELSEGDTVSVVGKDGSWFKIEWDGMTGYVYSKYIDYDGDTSSLEDVDSSKEADNSENHKGTSSSAATADGQNYSFGNSTENSTGNNSGNQSGTSGTTQNGTTGNSEYDSKLFY